MLNKSQKIAGGRKYKRGDGSGVVVQIEKQYRRGNQTFRTREHYVIPHERDECYRYDVYELTDCDLWPASNVASRRILAIVGQLEWMQYPLDCDNSDPRAYAEWLVDNAPADCS